MKIRNSRAPLLCAVPASLASLLLSFGSPAAAQTSDASPPAPVRMEDLVVQGEIGYRDRSEALVPTLEYDRPFFERFEPVSAGDALRRVPSVTFLSDVTESDGARLRGLSPGYTQILINGERVPGIGNDRSFFVDRIPAELIERVEVIRSNSATRPGEGVAGAINIVLRDSASIDGALVKVGGNLVDGDELTESLAGVWSGAVGNGRLVVSADQQGRYNPKVKTSTRFGDSPENNPNFASEEFDNREDQTDVRDSSDTALQTDYRLSFNDGGRLQLGGVWVSTDRTENERSFEHNDPVVSSGPENEGGTLETDNQQTQRIDETSYSLSARYDRPLLGGRTTLKLTAASFESDLDDRESEIDFGDTPSVIEEERQTVSIMDDEQGVELAQGYAFDNGMSLDVGVFYLSKERDTLILETDDERDLASYDRATQTPLSVSNDLTDLAPIDGGINQIDEKRADLFAAVSGQHRALSWEAGLRYESTDVTIRDLGPNAAAPSTDADYDLLLPSVALRYDLSGVDRATLAIARTVRRPDFDLILPVTLEDEIAENDLRGNPALQPETAWGLDLGYERQLGSKGIAGINLFYRDVSDLIELTNTGEPGSEDQPDDRRFIYEARNVGDGWVAGIEFDLSSPLGIIGLDHTGVFFNASFLDSEVEDDFGKRRFNDQSEFVYNVGLIQDLPVPRISFGATYREQGDAFGRVLGEEVTTRYGGDLEVFIEKRWDQLTLRAVGSNLLDSSKDEDFNKFDTIEDQRNRSFDEYELESEEAGPILRVVARYAF